MLSLVACGGAAPPSPAGFHESTVGETYRFPAEFEPQEAVWMAWPTYENKAGHSSAEVVLAISAALAGHVKVELLAQNEAEKPLIEAAFDAAHIPRAHVTLRAVAHADFWLRDNGPIFVENRRGNAAMVDFVFNGWGFADYDPAMGKVEDEVDRQIAHLRGFPIVKASVASEGGDREFNGKGTLMATWAVEQQRNPGKSRQEIEEEFGRVLGVRHFVWLPQGIAEDEASYQGPLPGGIYTPLTPGGHIDEYARFVDANTILLGEVSEEEAKTDTIRKMTRERLENARLVIEKSVDQDGKPFRIVRMPMPEPLYDTLGPGDGVYETLKSFHYPPGVTFPVGSPIRIIVSASYLNFLISNGVVVAQKYHKEGRPSRMKEKDESALRILREVFPGREVIAVDAEAVNLGGGGIHCITQQEPKWNVK